MVDTGRFSHDGREFEVWEGVYEPAEDSFMLLNEALSHPRPRTVEIGTGCGLIAITLSKGSGSRVVATDSSSKAVQCARANAARLSADIQFILGDLLRPIKGCFDLILFNPPYLPVYETGPEEPSWAGGTEGREVMDRFIAQVGKHLSSDGLVLLVQSSLNDLGKTRAMAAREGLRVNVLSRESHFFETLYVVSLERIRPRRTPFRTLPRSPT
jgi:release factor glutamine methyltransferase